MTPTPDPIAAIERALEGVTAGPWDVWREPTPTKADAIAEMAFQVENSEPFAEAVYLLNANGKCPATTGCGPTSAANAAYIAACNPVAITALLSLARKASSAEARVSELEREKAEMAKAALEVLNAVRDYLPPDGSSAKDCLSRIIYAVDNPTINPLLKKLEHDNVDA